MNSFEERNARTLAECALSQEQVDTLEWLRFACEQGAAEERLPFYEPAEFLSDAQWGEMIYRLSIHPDNHPCDEHGKSTLRSVRKWNVLRGEWEDSYE